MKHESRNATGELKRLLKKSQSSLVREPHRITNQENNTLDIIFDSARLVRDGGAQETWSTCNGTVVPVCRRQFQ